VNKKVEGAVVVGERELDEVWKKNRSGLSLKCWWLVF
jgi:hypothetical protein